jgi:hypothetical protein
VRVGQEILVVVPGNEPVAKSREKRDECGDRDKKWDEGRRKRRKAPQDDGRTGGQEDG